MELIIIIVAITAIIVIYSMMNMKIKELKAIALNKELKLGYYVWHGLLW